ncbi:hypothetical protein A2643_02770 [Candidatus Nomurabacteria bacterium RIFCSPHIGHO2_01_FULL_39_220]|uniref:Uncharacterized protein n=1 Tax=Candidatus Nomurabacteria bacterium RIFCSPLOWO2_02_FULL_40_67 TaxID=1801787 RepID=A0A1F6Y3A9_9BACT|nr:MAG: hypothetical protein A2W12_04080 [Candidatus Nomurabacteria bacterium RBG_16_40_11]OGI69621.1 MAG: hypothetical protein A2643_02770 [Candidatus Nomurabacteria bacterium RIFCSPHIGHO2_01_FULL_39_220]OGJ00815.1 MAG: hypothetical protein A3I23_01745 [Candidatus Nomurabacteria bacterium RIFCSPLOWO2_02_FULL_40_67]OGJ02792.1 MAG: hypothetical protein A3G48_03235 [Candidatus Nomurabacteria bacterium RIFCSPLOWO2_12_FULL_40_42]
MTIFFLKGILIGLLISIPLGPVAVFVIHRTISRDCRSGFMVGIGSLLANVIFAVAAIYGVSAIGLFASYRERLDPRALDSGLRGLRLYPRPRT